MGILRHEYCRCRRSNSRTFFPSRKYVSGRENKFCLTNSPTIAAYAPCLLEKKANEIRKNLDLEKGSYKHVRTVYESNDDRSCVNVIPISLLVLTILC